MSNKCSIESSLLGNSTIVCNILSNYTQRVSSLVQNIPFIERVLEHSIIHTHVFTERVQCSTLYLCFTRGWTGYILHDLVHSFFSQSHHMFTCTIV